ncbi:MAG: type ISP restriction/modification enzyme [Melioribacter sp.]|uniref:type ISP restriction/modification enzyme n=1 Tax=Melioribacter sp. TaxID=2052167 RepID=UPI003BDF35A7
MKSLLEEYLKNLTKSLDKGDAREESYYKHLENLIIQFASLKEIKNVDVTILPKKTEAGNPDFRIWDGKNHITGYIEAKEPSVTNLDYIEDTEQLRRYLSTFPNVILTNFYEFRLYRDGERIKQAMIGRPVIAKKLKTAPPVEQVKDFEELLELFFSYSLPKVQSAQTLAVELAKRTRFLRDEIISLEMEESGAEKGKKEQNKIAGFYEAFKKYLIASLTEKQFADLYAQTITYGLFAARTRASDEFNRKLAFDYIPHTIGILRDVFRFISLEDPPKSLEIIVDDISEILNVADVYKILREYHGKGKDPLIHFYETFLATYDPEVRERRGVYYTPEPVVNYIVRAVHSILKSRFQLNDGLASEEVKLLDPAGGTLTFPAEAIRIAVDEFKAKYGHGGLHRWIKKHILANFHAFELMMAPYAIGHLKIGFIFEELGYKMTDDERFKLYLTNALEMEEIEQIAIPGLSSLSEESHLAGKVKKEHPVLVILGNPPYSGISANPSELKLNIKKGRKYISNYFWNERENCVGRRFLIAKKDITVNQKTFVGDILMDYYFVDGEPLGEKNPKWLQDDYVKFLRFAQWKIQTSGYGIVGMITNHSYLDNPTFRGMRQSLMKTFDEIYILDLHGNSLKKETAPDGRKDENVFDIRQGVAIALFIRNKNPKEPKVYHADLYGLREEKYNWLENTKFKKENYIKIEPQSPYYFFVRRNTEKIKEYLNWKQINEIFPVNSVGIVTSRDNFVIAFDKRELKNRIMQFQNLSQPDEIILQAYDLKENSNWKIKIARQEISKVSDLNEYCKEILYRPFDERYIFYHQALIERMRPEVMRHMLEENIGLITVRQVAEGVFNHSFITENIVESRITLSNKGIGYLFPLYLYPDKNKKDLFNQHQTEKEPNIPAEIFDKLQSVYGQKPTPEEILYYIYAVFYSNIYRETYAEFLKVDFPRVPFTTEYKLFKSMSKLGNELADLHLLKSKTLDKPIAKYQGSGSNDKIEKVIYKEEEQRIYINDEKYFEGVDPEVWNYQIGGYQVLSKYLKDRKGRIMDDAPRYCRIVTALSRTIKLQKEIDEIYTDIEKKEKII